MKIIDISWPISESMTAYKNKKVVQITHTKTFEKDNARETILQLGSHTGTHVDAPSHFLKNGTSIDQQPLSLFIGECVVVDMTHIKDAIRRADLEAVEIPKGNIILFKTKNSFLAHDAPFDPNFIFLEKTGAHYLVEKKVKSVGIDYLGIERTQPDHETHTFLLQNNIGIIEGLRLQDVQSGNYMLYCLPIAQISLEAAPARAVLIETHF